MRVLVVGGAGYIGSHVVKELMAGGHEVYIFDNLSTGLKQNIPSASDFSNFYEGDIVRDYSLLDTVFGEDIDAFIHLAAFKSAGESMIAPEKYSINNIIGSINLLNKAVEHGVKYMIFSSSAAVYGEPQYLPLDEKHPKVPVNYYGFTKLEIERFMEWYSRLKGLRYASLRYFNAAGYDVDGVLYGLERNPANLIPVVMEVAMGQRHELNIYGGDYDTPDGTCIRDYIHVSDLARAHALALDYIVKEDKNLVLNLGTGQGASVKEIVEAARRITGAPIPAKVVDRRPGDPSMLYAKATLARDTIGWEANYSSIDTILETTYRAYKKYYQMLQ